MAILSLEEKLNQIKLNLQITPTETTELSLEDKLSKIKASIASKQEITTPAPAATSMQTPLGIGGQAKGGISLPETPITEIKESGLKDTWDAFKIGTSQLWQNTKQFFNSALPNLIFQDISSEETRKIEQKYGVPTGSITDETIKKINTKNQEKRDIYKVKYQKSEESYNKWLKEHPELKPRPEWDKGVIETIKKNPKVLLDPAYWGYVAAQSASFTMGVMGATLAATAITGNPLLGMATGVAVAYPAQAQDLYEELVKNGATEERASKLSVPIGAVIASVEVMGDLPLLSALSKPFKQMLSKNITQEIARNIIRKGITTFLKVEAAETLEEVIQQGIQEGTVKTVNENINILQNIPETVIQTLISTAPMAILGVGGEINTNLNQKISDIKGKEVIKTQTEQVTTKPEVIAEKAITKTVTGEGKVSKIAISIEAKSIEQGLTKGFGHLAEYTPIVIKEQAQKATDLINNNIDEARKIIRGEILLPEGLKGTSLITAMEEHIKKTADGELASELASSPLVSGTSAAAQELRLAAERDPVSPVKAIADVNKLLEERAKKRYPKQILTQAKAKITSDIQSQIKNEVKKANTSQSWQQFILSIQC